ncbi:MAG: glutamyl-tRNA reductase [Acidobacteriota bacterium]|nr:glutamyl-tRNA reductase [Acidobacteriota bacterium]MDQ3419030.1 glutamyl-tRNA reductase [Acidobacteriota bacterium]
MSVRLFAIGVNHRTAPVEVRERVDFAREGLEAALAGLAARNAVREMAVLSTCNRAEVYAAADSDDAVEKVARFFGEYHGVSPTDLHSHLYVHRGADAARHLFRVAAGLDSLVVGEPQILGQVKAAYTVASEQHYTGTVLNRLFHLAFAAGKRVRAETGLGEGAVSVSYAAISLARKIFGDLSRLQILILGSGEMGKLTATHLRSQGVAGITIASRTRSTAERLAQQIGASACDWSELEAALIQADIVVTATGAPTVVLTRADLEPVMKTRRERPLFVIDIAVPRDVDPAAGALDDVFLYNVDDLRGIVESNLEKRSAELSRADAIVSSEAAKFAAWLQSREIIPTVVALRDRFESIRRAELNRLQPKLTSLPPEAQAQVDHITRLIVEKLLLTPTEQLKAVSDDSLAATYSDALNRLFSLPPPADPLADEPIVTKPRKVT